MAIVIDPKAIIRYVLEEERELPEADQTVWLLKPISARAWARIKDRVATVNSDSGRSKNGVEDEGTKVHVAMGTQEVEALRNGLTGWENLMRANGVEFVFVPGEGGKITWNQLDWIPAKIREEVAGAIQGAAEPTDEEMANLASASPSVLPEQE